MSRIAFIINPTAGVKDQNQVANKIESAFESSETEALIFNWQQISDLDWVIADVLNKNIDRVIAVGGDGTVNAIGSKLAGSDVSMGIIPTGSGNGLARHLNIPLNVKKAIDLSIKGNVKEIDVCQVNGRKFFCTAGTGFDALISAAFSEQKTRGRFTYAKLILQKSVSYRAKNYVIEIDDKKIEREAFIVTVANANQFGNDFKIAPKAVIDDGEFDVCILNTFNKFLLGDVSLKLLNGTITNNKNYESFRAKRVKLTMMEEDWLHLDGEPQLVNGTQDFSVAAEKINMIVP